jgi:predicted SAM-dependent methyltransferase
MLGRIFSRSTRSAIQYDLVKWRARIKRWRSKEVTPTKTKLHLGCGGRHVPGWLNVDVCDSDFDVDLSCGRLPWKSNAFEAIASQHFIEHLEIETELIPLFQELHRVIRPQGEIWLSCPDIEKICRSYLDYKMTDLIADRKTRWPKYSTKKMPTSHMINDLFHQSGEHKNLFDFDMLKCLLEETGFGDVSCLNERDWLNRFPEFPARNDDPQTLYVMAIAKKDGC